MSTTDASTDDATITPRRRGLGEAGPAPGGQRTEVHSALLADSGSAQREVVVKSAVHAGRDEIRREAAVLDRLRDLQVVRLVDLTESADHTELVTERHGTLTLAEGCLLEGDRRGRALLSLCSAVDGLHQARWCHGSIDASHVLVDDSDVVRLCSLGSASEVLGDAESSTLADDREALGEVVRAMLETPGAFGSRSERRAWEKSAHRAIKRLSGMRGLLDGDRTAAVLVEAGIPGTSEDQDRMRWYRSPRFALVAAPVAALLGAGLAHFVVSLSGEAGAENPTRPCEVSPLGHAVPCEAIEISNNVVSIEGSNFEVGSPGDDVAVGDWDCDGTATALVLRLPSGELFEFTTWASQSDPTTGSLVGSFSGATSLAAQDPDVCGYPEVVLEEKQ